MKVSFSDWAQNTIIFFFQFPGNQSSGQEYRADSSDPTVNGTSKYQNASRFLPITTDIRVYHDVKGFLYHDRKPSQKKKKKTNPKTKTKNQTMADILKQESS